MRAVAPASLKTPADAVQAIQCTYAELSPELPPDCAVSNCEFSSPFAGAHERIQSQRHLARISWRCDASLPTTYTMGHGDRTACARAVASSS